MSDPAPTTASKKDPTSGCLIRGCLLAGFMVLVLGGLCAWSIYSTYHHLRAVTAEGPRTLPVFTYDPARYEHLEKEIAGLVQAARRGQEGEMRLTGADLNTLFAHARQASGFPGNLYFRVIENRLYMDCSVPLTGVWGFDGRWFNGEVVLGLLIEKDRLQIEPERITADEKEVPLPVLDAMKKLDWTTYFNPMFQDAFGRIRSVSIEENEIVLRTKAEAN